MLRTIPAQTDLDKREPFAVLVADRSRMASRLLADMLGRKPHFNVVAALGEAPPDLVLIGVEHGAVPKWLEGVGDERPHVCVPQPLPEQRRKEPAELLTMNEVAVASFPRAASTGTPGRSAFRSCGTHARGSRRA